MASILVFAPHPDDAELGMGGAIVKLARQGHKIHIVDMTNGEPTPHGSVETRAKESAAAAKVLGVERTLLGLKNREVVHDIPSRHKVAVVIRHHRLTGSSSRTRSTPIPITSLSRESAKTRALTRS